MTWYKLARPDGFDFHTGHTINYREAIGTVVTCPDYAPTAECGAGIHLSQNPNDCFQGASVPCSAYVVEPVAGLITIDEGKSKAQQVRVVQELHDLNALFGWDYSGLMQFLAELPTVPWFQADGHPDQRWRLFLRQNITAARDAAWDAARDAARDAAWAAAMDAARDAACVAVLYVCDGLPLDAYQLALLRARLAVWKKGYGLLCDVNGVLYVYGVEGGA